MYILCIGFICIFLFINDVITMLFNDVIVRALYISEMQCNLTLNVLLFSGVYCIVLKCLCHLMCSM